MQRSCKIVAINPAPGELGVARLDTRLQKRSSLQSQYVATTAPTTLQLYSTSKIKIDRENCTHLPKHSSDPANCGCRSTQYRARVSIVPLALQIVPCVSNITPLLYTLQCTLTQKLRLHFFVAQGQFYSNSKNVATVPLVSNFMPCPKTPPTL